MIVSGKVNRVLDTSGKTIVEIEVPRYQGNWLLELDKDVRYSFKITKASTRKSLRQNNYAWALMTDIAKELDMFPNAEAVYLQVLKMAKIKPVFLTLNDRDYLSEEEIKAGKTELTDEELKSKLSRYFRVVIIRERFINHKGNPNTHIEAQFGMSTFEKPEMNAFIDRLLYYAEMSGIDTREYETD